MLFLGGAVASIWLTLRDSRQRQLLGAIRTHPQRLDFSGRVDWQMRIRGRMVALTLDIQHWHPDRTRLDLVELDHPWFKGQAKDNPLVQLWLSRFKKRLASSRMRRVWNGLWDEPLLLRNYRLQLEPAPDYLQRSVSKLTIRPLRPHRPWLELLVDREQQMPLSIVQYAIDGSVAFRMAYQSIRFHTPKGTPPEAGLASSRWATKIALAEALRGKSPPLIPGRLPAGFRLEAVYRLRSRGPARPASWRLVFWDGLTRIVCYQTWKISSRRRNYRHRLGFANPKRRNTYKKSQSRSVTGQYGQTIHIRESAQRTFLRTKFGERTVILVGPLKANELLDCISSIKPSPTTTQE